MHPIFNVKYTAKTVNIMQTHTKILLSILETKVDKGLFDIEKYLHHCFVDITSQIMFGKTMDAQFGKNKEFIKYITEYDYYINYLIKFLSKNVLVFTT